MKVFLTGGTGFIGAPLTRQLVERGWPVTALSRSGASPHPAAAGVKGDVTDKESLRAAMAAAAPDVVIHNAGWYELGIAESDRAGMTAINVRGTENVLALAAELKIPRVVYTSTTTALGDTGGALVDETFTRNTPAITHYEKTKAEAHAIALKYQANGLPLIIVCPTQVIGPGDHSPFGWFARLYVRGLLPPVIWAPDGAFTFDYVDDVAAGIALAAEKGRPGETYLFGGGSLTMREIPPIWKKAVGGIPPFIFLPKPLALLQGAWVERILRLFKVPAFISREVVASCYVSFRYTSVKARRELGWQTRSAEQAWIDTLQAEKAKLRRSASSPGRTR